MGIGATISQVLEEKNMSVAKLAELTGISVNTLYAIIRRDNDSIKPESLKKISDALQKSPYFILGFKDGNEERISEELDLVKNKIDGINRIIYDIGYRINILEENVFSVDDYNRNIAVYLSMDELLQFLNSTNEILSFTISKIISEKYTK